MHSLPAIARRLWGTMPRVWAFNGLLALLALLLYLEGVARLPAGGEADHLFWPILAAIFALVSIARVYIHFQRSSQAYSLSEIPLVIGLFFSTPDELLLARVLGGVAGLGLVTRQRPVKLAFNLSSFAVETEAALLLFNALVPNREILSPGTWLGVLLVALVVASIGFLLSAVVIRLGETGGDSSRWRLPAGIGIGGGVVNGMLGMAIVATVVSDVPVTLLLLVPVLVLAAAYSLYTREHEKRQKLQQLYQSSDLLQRASDNAAAMPQFLQQLCDVFHAEAARLTLLPAGGITEPVYEAMARDGTVSESYGPLELGTLERFVPVLDEERRSFLALPPRVTAGLSEWLRRDALRNAIGTVLRSDGTLLGILVVGNRISDVSVFDAQDIALLETFAAQASAAVQTSRLGSRLAHQAFHDPLTGLANRALLIDRLEYELRRRGTERRAVCVMFVDLDDFKIVNDTLGHSAGDAVLRAVAQRLQDVLRPSDTVARFGGDEFAVLLDAAEPYESGTVAERIIASLEPHFLIGERAVPIRASIGAAVADTHVDAGELLRRADVAMYRAKARHKGTFEIYEPGMQEAIARRLELRADLELAVQRDELRVYYQPVVDVDTLAPVTIEALLRWTRATGTLGPAEFIGIAEESGLIYDIGLYVLRQACRQCHEWQALQMISRAVSVSVNVSPWQLSDERFVGDVHDILIETELPPSRLVLEITESVMAEDMQGTRERLQELKAIGVRIALDDFGTGYSSLAILQELPIDYLKIDRAFIEHIADDSRRRAFVKAMIRMGRTLGMGLIAEGVELPEQVERLRALGCRMAQGYLFARPAPPRELSRRLAGARYAAPGAPPTSRTGT